MTQVQSAKPWNSTDGSKKRIYVVMSDGRTGYYDRVTKTAHENVTIEECKAAMELSRAASSKPNCLGQYYAKTAKPQTTSQKQFISRSEMERLQQDSHSKYYNQ